MLFLQHKKRPQKKENSPGISLFYLRKRTMRSFPKHLSSHPRCPRVSRVSPIPEDYVFCSTAAGGLGETGGPPQICQFREHSLVCLAKFKSTCARKIGGGGGPGASGWEGQGGQGRTIVCLGAAVFLEPGAQGGCGD